MALMRWLRDPELGAVSGCPWRRPAEPSRVARDGLRASQRRRLGRDLLPSLRPPTGEACKSDREIVLKIVEKKPSCLRYAGKACNNDREIVLKAMETEPSCLEYYSDDYSKGLAHTTPVPGGAPTRATPKDRLGDNSAWGYFTSTGVVTGGDYTDRGTGSSCYPFSLAPCAHHVPATSKCPACPSGEYPSPRCSRSCSDSGYSKSFSADKARASTLICDEFRPAAAPVALDAAADGN